MESSPQAFDALFENFIDYLKKIQRRPATIDKYSELWGRLRKFINSRKIEFYDKTVGNQFLTHLYGNYDYYQLTRYPKNIVNCIESLSEYQQTGKIAMGPRKKPVRTFTGLIGATIESFITYKKDIYQLCESTLYNYRYYLHGLYLFFEKKSIRYINQINQSAILSFINDDTKKTAATRHGELLIIKAYFRYLFQQQLSPKDYSDVIPKDNYKTQSQLPTTFSTEEIHALLTSIDRGSPRGKRDYAIILLATKLGLRASDITALKFEHIYWEKHIISFQQRKTRKDIKVPLLPEIGNAFIDYLKNGRPESKENYCFLQIQSPFSPLDKGSIGNIVRYHLNLAGINYKNRKHGPHALRHSLAANLLQNKIPIPVISETLGHSDSETTMYYLRIDTTSLRQCALNVPAVDQLFYNQK
jgi:site-specific recombinase XerD